MSNLERRKNSVIDDFMETDSSCKKWVRKCREMAEVVARSVDRIDSIRRQMEKKERNAMDGLLFVCLSVVNELVS